MTQIASASLNNPAPAPAGPSASGERADFLLHTCLMAGLGILTCGVAAFNVQLLRDYPFLRTQVLVGEIAAGTGVAACFGGAMHFLDQLRDSRNAASQTLRWHWRAVAAICVRLMLIGQLLGAALIVAAFAAFLFDVDKKYLPEKEAATQQVASIR